jgi:hypothetical protein
VGITQGRTGVLAESSESRRNRPAATRIRGSYGESRLKMNPVGSEPQIQGWVLGQERFHIMKQLIFVV